MTTHDDFKLADIFLAMLDDEAEMLDGNGWFYPSHDISIHGPHWKELRNALKLADHDFKKVNQMCIQPRDEKNKELMAYDLQFTFNPTEGIDCSTFNLNCSAKFVKNLVAEASHNDRHPCTAGGGWRWDDLPSVYYDQLPNWDEDDQLGR